MELKSFWTVDHPSSNALLPNICHVMRHREKVICMAFWHTEEWMMLAGRAGVMDESAPGWG